MKALLSLVSFFAVLTGLSLPLSIHAQAPVNDEVQNAIVLTDFDHWFSADEAYTNVGATPSAPLNASNDVWFKFSASTEVMEIKLLMLAGKGNISLPWIHFYDGQMNLITSKRASWYNVPNMSILAQDLIPDQEYFIGVSSATAGTFTLFLNDTITYDFVQGAHDLTGLSNWYSADAEFSTHYATQDTPHPLSNKSYLDDVWFKFEAQTTEAEFKILAGGGKFQYGYGNKGTARLWNVRLYDDSLNILRNMRSLWYDNHVIGVSHDSLEVGKTYYASMTNYSPYATFSVFFNDVITNDFQAGAIQIPHNSEWYSGDSTLSNLDYSPDSPRSPEMNSMHNGKRYWTNDAWFEFTATTNEILAEVLTGGAYGDLSAPRIHLYDEALNLIHWDEAAFVSSDLIVGEKYYLTVSAQAAGGTYSLRVKNDANSPDNNHQTNATLLTDLNEWYSANEEFTNLNSTISAPLENQPAVWFKFVATTDQVEAKVLTSGDRGNIFEPKIRLFSEDDAQLAYGYSKYAQTYRYGVNNTGLYYQGLTPGTTYYLAVSTDNQTDAGTFKLHVSDQISHDYFNYAIDLTGLGVWKSDYQAYTNTDASREAIGPYGYDKNVWFKFTAESEVMEFKAFDQGTIGLIYMYAYDEDMNQIGNKRSNWYNSPVVGMQLTGLTPGEPYYVSISGGEAEGEFAVSVSPSPTNDFKASAYEITDTNEWSSADAAFTNVDYSPDRPGVPKYSYRQDAWFKFTARSTDLTAELRRGGSFGTASSQLLQLFSADNTQLASSTSTLNTSGLNIGETYYLVAAPNVAGTFSLYLDCYDEPRDFYAIANGNWNDPNTWSLTEGGTAGTDIPSAIDRVFISSHTVTVSDNRQSGEVTIIPTSTGKLLIDGSDAFLKVFGSVNMSSLPIAGKLLEVINSGRIQVVN